MRQPGHDILAEQFEFFGEPSKPAFETVPHDDKLANHNDTLIILPRDRLDQITAQYSLTGQEDLPTSYRAIDRAYLQPPTDTIFTTDIQENTSTGLQQKDGAFTGDTIGIDPYTLKQAVRFCNGAGSFNSDDFHILTPDQIAPYVLVSERTPEKWLIHCEHGLEDFFSTYGVTDCDNCGHDWDHPTLQCPQCMERPQLVTTMIDSIEQDHSGVICLIGPTDPRQLSFIQRLQFRLLRLLH
jgi:hypothetical protein